MPSEGGDFGDREFLDDLGESYGVRVGESYGVRVGDPGLLLLW